MKKNPFEDARQYTGAAPDGKAKSEQKANGSTPPPLIHASPYQWIDTAGIPPREFLHGRDLPRGSLSVDLAPGGLGKTSYKIAQAIALVTGRSLLGQAIPRQFRVWLYNLEDPLDELRRRIQATCQHYRVSAADLGDRLYVNGCETPLCITKQVGRGAMIIDAEIIAALMAEIVQQRIDVFSVDPFVSSHRMPENDNMGIDLVAKTWGRIATETKISVSSTHHTRKQGSVEIDAESGRGAKALVDAARSINVMNRMTPQEAGQAGVDNHRKYFRIIRDKANLTPPADKSDWYQLVNVPLANGDQVGVVAPWEWPDAFKGVKVEHLMQVQKAVEAHRYRRDAQAKDWVGHAVGRVLGIDSRKDKANKANRARISSLLSSWIYEGALEEFSDVDEHREQRTFVRVGRWVGEDE